MQRHRSLGSETSGPSEGAGSTVNDSGQGTGEGGEQAAGEEEGDASAELLTQQGSIQEAVFGVLYTLSKERLNEGWRFVVFAMVLDYLQLAVFFIGNNFPWNYNFYAWYWKWLSWVCLTNMFPKGTGLIDGNYNLYLAIFFVLTGFLVVSAALCIFVGINFKSNHFPYVWPIKVLKLAVSFFFELFYISTLGIFIIALDCTYYNPVKVNEKFRSELCFKMPHLVVVAISIVTSLLAMAMAYFIAVANSELDPLSKELNSQAHNRSALKRYALISLITVINEVFPSYTKIQGIACIIIMGYLCHNYVRYMPFQTAWINGLQASFFASLTWASFLIILMAFFYPYSNHEAFSVLVWVGLLAVIPLVWVILYFRVRHTHKVALMYRMALKSDNGPVIHKFVDELEVEIVARCGRIRDKYGDLMPVWVDTAEAVYKAGLAQFPESAYLNIAYSSFLIHHRSAMQVGAGLLEVARKLEPSIGERFMIFVRDREQKQRGGSGADGSSYDLLSYVEYQNNFKALMAVHRQALKANRSFWRQLVRKDIAFEDLTRAFSAMETAEKRADSTFRMVLDRYPNNPKLLLAYALYLETVKSNPSHATRYRAEAARCDKTSPQAAQNPALTDGFEGSGESAVTADRSSGAIMDNSADAMVVINDKGVIQFVNKKLLEMFGYKQGQLEGKNVAGLMPPPYSNHHNQYMQRFKKTGKAFRVGKSAFHTVALHAQGFSLPVTLAIKELQQGDAKAYRGVFKPVNEDNHAAVLWVDAAGHILGLNRGLHNAFGYSLADIRGELVGSVGADEGLTQQFKTVAELLKKWEFSAAELGTSMYTFQVALKHKYGAVFPASGSVSFAGTDAVRLMAFKFALAEGVEKLALISMTPAGQVVYANPTLEKMLGYEPGFLVGKQKTIRELVRPPYGQLHLRWMLQAAQNAEYNSMAPCSCRTGRGVLLVGRNNVQVPVTMRVVEAEVGKMRCLTASITQLEVPEPDAWGGGDVKDVWNNSKRLLLLVHADGRVLAYKADPDTALHGFGQNVRELCGKFVSEVVKDFTKPAGFSKDWPSVPHLLARLAQQTSKAHAAWGAPSFRVGVVPSATAAAQLKQKPKGHAHATIPCRMIVLPVADSELELQELLDAGTLKEEDVSSGQLHVVKLRQDDMIEAVLEIDAQMKIKAADVEASYLFGSNAVKGHSLKRFISPQAGRPDSSSRVEDFLAVKRTQLKRGDHQAVGEKLEMEALHADGSRMLVQLQGADKYGDGTRWVLRVTVQPNQPASERRPSLLEALSRSMTVASKSPQSSRCNSPGPEENQLTALAAPGNPNAAKAQSADGRSEHSQDDATSNMDGVSMGDSEAAESHGNFNNYQRAKRFRKLNKMLSSPKAQQRIRILKWASIAMLFLLLGVHALFFGLTSQGIKDYESFFKDIVVAGEAATNSNKLTIGMRILISCTDATAPHTLRSSLPTWAAYYLGYYTPWVSKKAANFEEFTRELMFGFDRNHLTMPSTEDLRVLFLSNAIAVKQVSPTRSLNMSLWDLSVRFATAGQLMAATAPTAAGASLANMSEVKFISLNRVNTAVGVMKTLTTQRTISSIKIAQLTKELTIFVASEAGGLIPLCCLCLYLLLKRVNQARLKLFNVFLAVPRPVVMQLATREVQVSLDPEDGDEDDGDAWLRQAEAGSGSSPAKGVGFNLTTAKRKLRTNGLASYIMLSPFLLWSIIVAIVFAISIFRLRGSSASVSNLVYANLLQLYVGYAFSRAIGIAFTSSATEANSLQTELVSNLPTVTKYLQGLLYGDASLGLEGAVRLNNHHEELWFGQGCLSTNSSTCLQPSSPYYEATSNGLNHLVNTFILHCQELTKMTPAVNISYNTPSFAFLWAVAREGKPLEDGLTTNTANFVSDGQGRMTLITVLQVLTMVLGVIMVLFFYFRMLMPFMRHSKKESRRVAELMSQLPAEMNVEYLVLSSTNQDDGEEELVEGQPAKTWMGRLFASCWGRGKAGVLPDPKQAAGREAANLNIVVSQNTSKDKETPVASPAVGAHDVSTKFNKAFKEKMHRHRSERDEDEEDDPTLWDSHLSPRKVAFAFPT